MNTPFLIYRRTDLEAAGQVAELRGQTFRYSCGDSRIGNSLNKAAIQSPSELESRPTGGDVLVTRPILDLSIWKEAVSRCKRFTTTVDHFVHTEAIEQGDWKEPLGVMIEVAVGPARFGLRPGRDTVDLATVVSMNERLQFRGLSAEVCSPGMAESLLQTREQVERAGITCESVSVRCSSDLCQSLPAGIEVRHSAEAVVGTLVTAISRPSLETVVIDIGREAGLIPKSELIIESTSEAKTVVAKVRQIEAGRTLLTLPEDAFNITIGDTILIRSLLDCYFESDPAALETLSLPTLSSAASVSA